MTVGGKDIPLEFDGRKMFLNVQKPSEQDMNTMEIIEVTSPLPFAPESTLSHRRDRKIKYKNYPGGLTMERRTRCCRRGIICAGASIEQCCFRGGRAAGA